MPTDSNSCRSLHCQGHKGPLQGCHPTAPNPQTLRHVQNHCALGNAVPWCPQCTPGQPCTALPTRASCRNSGQQQLQSTAITSCLQGHATATQLSTLSPNQPALPKAIDCKRSLNPIQMIHLHLGLPSTALAIQGCVCKCCFPFIPVWP